MTLASACWAAAKNFHSAVPLAELRTANLLRACFPHDIVLQRQLWGYAMPLRVQRSNAHALLYLCGERFLSDAKLVAGLIRPGLTVFDVGANIGYFSLFAARGVGECGCVYSFEPDPTNFAELQELISRNQISQCHPINAAVGESDGSTTFAPGLNGRIGGDQTVRMLTLDSFGVTPDFIKIDVEGYELQVLRGMKSLLGSCPIFVELHPRAMMIESTPGDVLTLLVEHYNVKCFLADNGKPVSMAEACRCFTERFHLLCHPK